MISLSDIETARERLRKSVISTPVLPLTSDRWAGIIPDSADVTLKLELFQEAGSFKARGAVLGIAGLSPQEREAGVVAASGGNHALAVSWAARSSGVAASIMMPRATDPERVAGCEAMGAEVSLHDDMPAAFAAMEAAVAAGGTLMHPFEAEHMILGSATLGAELFEQCPDLDVVVIPVGGGGLIAGMARALKLLNPDITVIGVEPEGADSTRRSLSKGRPVELDRIDTIADSLGSPRAMPLTFGYAQNLVDDIVTLPDGALLQAMRCYMDILRIRAEPACVASLAAAAGPLRERLAGQRVGLIACGSNIGRDRYEMLLAMQTQRGTDADP